MALRDLIITPAQRIIFAAARAKARRAAKLDLELDAEYGPIIHPQDPHSPKARPS